MNVNNRHHFFKCSNCNAPLLDIWVQHVDENLRWKFVVECPHCNDKSYEQEICGTFAIGTTEESEKYTAIDSYDIDSDPIIIKTKKVADYV